MTKHIAGARRGALLLAAAGLVGCTPPWYRLLVVTVEGRFLADGTCTAAARGDVTGRLRLPARGTYLHTDNLPRPLPPTTLVLGCERADPMGRPWRLESFIATPDGHVRVTGWFRVRAHRVVRIGAAPSSWRRTA
jgi:hypothetical protein